MTIEDSFDVPFFLQTQASKVSSYHIQYIDRRLGGPVAKWLKQCNFTLYKPIGARYIITYSVDLCITILNSWALSYNCILLFCTKKFWLKPESVRELFVTGKRFLYPKKLSVVM